MEAAAKRKPDRAQPQVKRRTEMGWPGGPTIIKGERDVYHEESDSQANVPEGSGCYSGTASARCNDSRCHRMGQDPGEAGPEAGIRVYPHGVRSRAMDPVRPGRAPRAFTDPRSAQPGQRSADCDHQHTVAKCLPGYARHIQLHVSERGLR